MGKRFETQGFFVPGEGQAAGEEHGRGPPVPGAVFVVSGQRKAPGSELDPDLVAAAGMEPDADQAFIPGGEPPEFQPGFFHAAPLPVHDKDLVAPAVLPQKVFPVAGFRRSAVDQGHILLHHGALLHSLGQLSGSLFGPGVDHEAADIFVQTVDGEDLAAEAFLQGGGEFVLGIQAHRLDADKKLLVGIENVHGMTSGRSVFSSIPQTGEKSKERLREIEN